MILFQEVVFEISIYKSHKPCMSEFVTISTMNIMNTEWLKKSDSCQNNCSLCRKREAENSQLYLYHIADKQHVS